MASNNPNISDLVSSNGYLDVLECATQSVLMLNSHYPLVFSSLGGELSSGQVDVVDLHNSAVRLSHSSGGPPNG